MTGRTLTAARPATSDPEAGEIVNQLPPLEVVTDAE
jgi:hypothetical protein